MLKTIFIFQTWIPNNDILTEDWKSGVWSDLMRTMATNEPRISDNSSPTHIGIPFDHVQ